MTTRRDVIAGSAGLAATAILPTTAAAIEVRNSTAQILLIESDVGIRVALGRYLLGLGYWLVSVDTAASAETMARKLGRSYNLVVCGTLISGTPGTRIVSSIRHWVGAIPVVYRSRYPLRDLPGDDWRGEGTWCLDEYETTMHDVGQAIAHALHHYPPWSRHARATA
jgi:hypothetical protein